MPGQEEELIESSSSQSRDRRRLAEFTLSAHDYHSNDDELKPRRVTDFAFYKVPANRRSGTAWLAGVAVLVSTA